MTRPPQNIGWSKVEILYLRAAMTLSFYEGICALDDIATITGRTLSALRSKLKALEAEDQTKTATKSILVPAQARQGSAGRPRHPNDPAFRWPSRAALTGSSAKMARSPIVVVNAGEPTTPSR
jgi:hypothetical protein